MNKKISERHQRMLEANLNSPPSRPRTATTTYKVKSPSQLSNPELENEIDRKIQPFRLYFPSFPIQSPYFIHFP